MHVGDGMGLGEKLKRGFLEASYFIVGSGTYTYRSTSWKVLETQTRSLSARLKKKVSNIDKI